jgi:hypothetical protein
MSQAHGGLMVGNMSLSQTLSSASLVHQFKNAALGLWKTNSLSSDLLHGALSAVVRANLKAAPATLRVPVDAIVMPQ